MGRGRDSSAAAVWRERLARFGRGKLSVAEFCRREGVSNPSFYQWRKRLERPRSRSGNGRPTVARSRTSGTTNPFVEVNVVASVFSEIEFPNGVRIRVPATDADALRVALVTGNDVCREVS